MQPWYRRVSVVMSGGKVVIIYCRRGKVDILVFPGGRLDICGSFNYLFVLSPPLNNHPGQNFYRGCSRFGDMVVRQLN